MKQKMRDLELIEIAQRCLLGRSKIDAFWAKYAEQHPTFDYTFRYTMADFGVLPKTKEDLKRMLKSQKVKNCLCSLMSFIDLYQHCTSRKVITELAISTTTSQLVQVLHNQKSVSNMIDRAERVHLLVCVNSDYSYAKPNDKKSKAYSKRYIYCKEVQDLIKRIVEEEGWEYEHYLKKNRIFTWAEAKANAVPESIRDQVKVSSGLRIDASKIDEETVRMLLDKRYPMVVKCKELANYDNEHFLKNWSQEQIKCEWHITYSKSGKKITRIGFRATSGIVSLKEHENENPNYSGVWRKEYLADRFKGKTVYSFDVKSSIFRVTFWLNFGVWLDNKIDLYRLMYGRDFKDEKERLAYKCLKMRTYFDGEKQIAKHIMPVFDKENEGDAVSGIIGDDKKREEEVIGRSWGSEVFVYESCVYMELVHRLRMRGIEVVQVYDGFYSDNKDIEKECIKELSVIVSEFETNYLSSNERVVLNHNEVKKRIKSLSNNICINSRKIIDSSTNGRKIFDDIPDDPDPSADMLKLYEAVKAGYLKGEIGPINAVNLIRRMSSKLDYSFVRPNTGWKPKGNPKTYEKEIAKAIERIDELKDEPLPKGVKVPNLKDFMNVGLF